MGQTNSISISSEIISSAKNYKVSKQQIEQSIIEKIDISSETCKLEPDKNNNNVLSLALKNKMPKLAEKLIEIFGKDCNQPPINNKNKTSLIIAIKKGYSNIATLIIKNFGEDCCPEVKFNYGNTVLDLALEKEKEKISISLIETFGNKCIGKNSLYISLNHKKFRVFKILLNQYSTCCHPNYECLVKCIFYKKEKLATELISKFSSNIKIPTYKYTSTPILLLACQSKMENVALDLIKIYGEKLQPEHCSSNGDLALTCAIRNNLDILANELIDKFGDSCLKYMDDNKSNPLKPAIINKNEQIALKLLETFGNKLIKCRDADYFNEMIFLSIYRRLEQVAIKIVDTAKLLILPEKVNKSNRTPLISAIDVGMEELAIKLLETFGYKNNLKQVDKYGETALTIANIKKMTKVSEIIQDINRQLESKPVSDEDLDETICGICEDNKRQITFNCSHFYCCEHCAEITKKCPICREPITERIKSILS